MDRLDEIKTILLKEIPDSQVEVSDMTGTQDHLELSIKSPVFKGLSLLKQHQLVMDALQDELKGALHAVKIKARFGENREITQNFIIKFNIGLGSLGSDDLP